MRKIIFIIPFIILAFIWLIYWIEIKFNLNFNNFGIYPRTLKGLKGVFFMPFIHSNTTHLFNNSIPLFIFLSTLFYFYKDVSLNLLIKGWLLSGFITWVIGRDSLHIGSSGIVYLLFSFIFFSGIIKKHYRLVAVSLLTIFLYGSMIWYILPIEKNISWEGHLSGFIVGFYFSYIYRKKGVIAQKIEYEKTDFDDCFDNDGNYQDPKNDTNLNSINVSKKNNEIKYKYIYIEKTKK